MPASANKRSKALMVMLFVVAGCRAPSPTNESPSYAASLRRSETDAYSAFVDEFCDKWASINGCPNAEIMHRITAFECRAFRRLRPVSEAEAIASGEGARCTP